MYLRLVQLFVAGETCTATTTAGRKPGLQSQAGVGALPLLHSLVYGLRQAVPPCPTPNCLSSPGLPCGAGNSSSLLSTAHNTPVPARELLKHGRGKARSPPWSLRPSGPQALAVPSGWAGCPQWLWPSAETCSLAAAGRTRRLRPGGERRPSEKAAGSAWSRPPPGALSLLTGLSHAPARSFVNHLLQARHGAPDALEGGLQILITLSGRGISFHLSGPPDATWCL